MNWKTTLYKVGLAVAGLALGAQIAKVLRQNGVNIA